MRILIADDEQIMLDSICHILANEPDLQVETARTGREAIEKAEAFRPELVMMDLKMPGINGLEALTEIRRIDSQVVIIIISAYESFNYAQEAIRLHVFDYLVKPISRNRLLEQIEKVRERLAKLRAIRQEELALRERYKKLAPLIENELIWELINGIDEAALHEYQELLAREIKAGFFLAVSYHDKAWLTVESPAELGYLRRQKTAVLGEEIRHLFTCFVGALKAGPLLVFVPVNDHRDNCPDPREIAQKILAKLQNPNSSTEIRIGIGRFYKTAPEMKRSYQEAILALNHQGQQPVQHFDDLPQARSQNWETDLQQELQSILNAIRFGNERQAQNLLQPLASKYSPLNEDEQDRLRFYLLEFLLAASHLLKDRVKYTEDMPVTKRDCSFQETMAIFSTNDPHRMFGEISQRIITLAKMIKEGHEKQVKGIIRRAKEIIDRQFRGPLNLEDVSHAVGISPFYFSRLFREELGISFSEYLTKLRMEAALALLAQGLPVKECCFSVGYNDPNYFSRIFRKFYNISPSEYREAKIGFKGGEVSNHD
ncbi:MAG: response regulator [Firmicutes bacterium]|nr:response regulator [Bacillota bacterium]